MAKYCANCGKALADGVEICPDCGGVATEDGAALFTRMTAETEGWNRQRTENKVRKERQPRTESQKQLLAYIGAAIAVIVVAVCLILYIQPCSQVVRAIRSGEYDRALELYWGNTRLSSGEQDETILPAAKRAAEQVVEAFAKHEMNAEEAASALSKLGTLGEDAEALLARDFENYRQLSTSLNHMEKADQLRRNGDYLAARQEYLLVSEDDSDYEAAQAAAQDSIREYADTVLSEADIYIQSKDYISAIQSMNACREKLTSLDVYNEALEYKLDSTYQLYEDAALASAAEQASKQNYTAAAELLRRAMDRFGRETEAMVSARDGYLEMAGDKAVTDAALQAESLYDQGMITEAFSLLETMRSEPDAQTDEIDAALTALEQRFATDQIEAARAIFNGKRDNLPEAVLSLKAALRVRPLDAIEAYLDEISGWLPVSLAEMEYVDKQGTIFRSASTFEGLDGVEYSKGWIWGEDGAELTFILNGGYDLMEGVLAVRREDEIEAGGHFEVLCDGEVVYVSETLNHPETNSSLVHVDISGCDRLTLRFVNDYSVRTADNGYCYHGFCSPTITKYLEGDTSAAPEVPAAESPASDTPSADGDTAAETAENQG